MSPAHDSGSAGPELTDQERLLLVEQIVEVRAYIDNIKVECADSIRSLRHQNPNGKPTRVHVHDGAFLSMLTSSVEVYPTQYLGGEKSQFQEGEVCGNLFGTVQEDENAITYDVLGTSVVQSYVIREEGCCQPSAVHRDRMREIAGGIPGIMCIGRFHSHPYESRDFRTLYYSHWSPGDYRSTLGQLDCYDVPPLEIICALASLNSRKRRAASVKPSYIVSYCNNFKFVLRAFAFECSSYMMRDVSEIRCPLAESIRNRTPPEGRTPPSPPD